MNNQLSFVTVYTVTYNEEVLIEFFIKHYRRMFPNCIIKIYDNYSTDDTVEIAKSFGCEIEYFMSQEGKDVFDDRAINEIKNNAWKNATTDWVVVCDSDELIQITQEELIEEERNGYNIIAPEGWHMINNKNNIIDLENMERGWQDWSYSKKILFNKKFVSNMNYSYGAHTANPIGKNIKQTPPRKYVLTHYKFISKEYSKKRRDIHNKRWSNWNVNVLWKGYDKKLIYCPDVYWDEWYSKPLTNIKHLMK